MGQAAGILGAIGSVVSAAGSIAAANAQVAAAKAEQLQLNQIAAEKVAIATRRIADKDREKKLLMSRGQAVAASSGGGATDPTVLELMGGIEKTAFVQQGEMLAQAQTAANLDRYQGRVGVAVAKANRTASTIGAIGGALAGGTEAFAKYGAPSIPSASGSSLPSLYGTSAAPSPYLYSASGTGNLYSTTYGYR
jgi:hypothetical protein